MPVFTVYGAVPDFDKTDPDGTTTAEDPEDLAERDEPEGIGYGALDDPAEPEALGYGAPEGEGGARPKGRLVGTMVGKRGADELAFVLLCTFEVAFVLLGTLELVDRTSSPSKYFLRTSAYGFPLIG